MVALLKKFPWWGWIIVVIAIFFLINYASSRALNRSLFNMALDQLREDQTAIIEAKEAYIEDCEAEILKLAEEKEILRKQKEAIQRQVNASAAEIARLEGNIRALEKKFRDIVVGTNVDELILDLNKRGLSTIRRHKP